MKKILGGVAEASTDHTCAVDCRMPDGGIVRGISKQWALQLYNECVGLGYSANWCCDSCDTATWL